MPRVSNQLNGFYDDPDVAGPIAQVDLSRRWSPDGVLPLPAIAKATPFDSGMLYADGFRQVAVGVKMDQAGTLSMQRYLDEAGQLPVGAAITGAITANQAAVLSISDSYPFNWVRVTIANSGTPNANVAAFALNLNAS